VALDDGRVVGSTLLIRSVNQNSPHRAEIGKVIVLGSHRRRGLASALMRAAEDRARAEGRWLLVLDTVTGSAPMRSTDRSAGRRPGVVPNYALNPDGSRGRRRSSGRTSDERRVADGPDRARFVQGVAEPRRGRVGDRRRLAPGSAT
jgi:hypothetical protein